MLGTVINLVLQIFSGALGGHLAEVARSNNLSKLAKTLMGAVGGVIGGQVLGLFIPLLENTAGSPSVSEAVGQVITGGLAGAVFTAILGVIGNKSSA
jgi:CDP-diglyceride synthetase